jgi:hypothetical protein
MSWIEAEHVSASGYRWQMRALAICAATAMVTGIVGFLQQGDSLFTAVYQTLQLFFLESLDLPVPVPPLIQAARWLAAASTLLAVLKAGGLLFQEERTSLRLRRMSGHTILCGPGRTTMRLMEHLTATGENVVVIDKNPPAELVRDCARTHAHVLGGDATDPCILNLAGIGRAHRVFALCSEDSTNCEIATQVRRVKSESHGSVCTHPLLCHVHLTDVDLRSSLQRVFAKDGGGVALRFFDLFDMEARRVLREYLHLDGRGLSKDDPRRAHLIILGFGRMGRTLAVRAAQVSHFANGKRLQISVIDRRAELQEQALLFRYPRFREVCDLNLHSLEAETPHIRSLLEKWCSDKQTLPSVAVCFENEPRAIEIALQLQTVLGIRGVPIAIRMACQSGLARLLQEQCGADGQSRLPYVRPFGMYEDCGLEALTEGEDRLARLIHLNCVEERCRQGAPVAGNPVLKDWEDLDEDFRESSRQQAAHIPVKLRAIGCEAVEQSDPRPAVDTFAPDHVELMTQMEHARWVAERVLAGWTFAPGTKDVQRRTSPDLVPWDELSPEIQQYDRDAVVLIPTLLAADGKKICRRNR